MGQVLVSAHRSNGREALLRSCALPCDYVEFDIQRTADGVFVLRHDPKVTIGRKRRRISDLRYNELLIADEDLMPMREALSLLAGVRGAHVDLKFCSPDGQWEVDAARIVVDAMGADCAIVTSRHSRSTRAIRAWSRHHAPELLVGLSLWPHEVRILARLRRADANLVAAHRRLARLHGAWVSRRAKVPLLVWTVDEPRYVTRWMAGRAWMVTTNRPTEAVANRVRDPAASTSIRLGPFVDPVPR